MLVGKILLRSFPDVSFQDAANGSEAGRTSREVQNVDVSLGKPDNANYANNGCLKIYALRLQTGCP